MDGTTDTSIKLLTVPGWTGSGDGHWQSYWERANKRIQRVVQDDWDDPDPELWCNALEVQIRSTGGNPVLIAHSCGVLTIMRWAQRLHRSPVKGAFLVAPPDPEAIGALDEVRRFGPVTRLSLPIPSMVVASRNDPHCTFERAHAFADSWGSELIDGGNAGHFNTASGYGPWPEGTALLSRFVQSLL